MPENTTTEVVARDSSFAESAINSSFSTEETTTQQQTQETSTTTGATETQQGATQQAAEEPINNSADFSFSEPPAETQATGQQAAQQTQQAAPQSVKDLISQFKREDILEALGLDTFSREFIDFRNGGGDPYKYLEAKSIDWNKVPDIELIKQEFRENNKHLEGDKLEKLFNYEMKKKYSLDDNLSEEEIELGKIRMESDAYQIRQRKIQDSSKLQIPQVSAQSQETVQDIAPLYLDNPYTKSLFQNKKVVADGGEEGYQFNFNVAKPEALIDFWLNPKVSGPLLYDESGKPNMQKKMLMSLVAYDEKFVIKSLIDFGKQLGERERLKRGQGGERSTSVMPQSQNTEDWSNARDGRVGDHIRG